jgi:mannose-1-phosphate guanylyltransferase
MYGLVRTEEDGSVTEFLEKPSPEEIDTNLINAGVYVLDLSILDEMEPAGTNVSIEREVFPKLVGRGLYGFLAEGYWLDVGTPARYLQGTFDILEGNVETELGRQLDGGPRVIADGATVEGRVIAPALVGNGSSVAHGAIVGGRATLEPDVIIGAGAHIENSVVLEGATVGAHTRISGSIVGPRAKIGERCQLEDGVVVGEGVELGAGNVLRAGARLFPGVRLPEQAIRF